MRGEGIGFINCFLKDVSFNVAKMRLFYLGMWRRVEIDAAKTARPYRCGSVPLYLQVL